MSPLLDVLLFAITVDALVYAAVAPKQPPTKAPIL